MTFDLQQAGQRKEERKMDDVAIDPVVVQLCQLLWSPAQWLHTDWWRQLDLASWSDGYHQLGSAALRGINALICQRRQFPSSLPLPQLNEQQRQLLQAASRLESLIIALGLIQLACPDYLFYRPYRQQLTSVLSDYQLEQLWGLWPGGASEPKLSEQLLRPMAYQTGFLALASHWDKDPVWQALSYTLPAIDSNLLPEQYTSHNRRTIDIFSRLERFL